MTLFHSTYEVDWLGEPCLRADVLRRAYYGLLSGQLAVETEYVANGVQRRVRYSQVDISRLEMELRAADAECAGTTGRRVSTIRLATSKGI